MLEPHPSRLHRWAPVLWCLALVGLLLGPALAPGYVLTYDLVWVPQLTLRPDFLGLSSAVPRAVPSDALVAVLDNLVPAMVLQKIVLVGGLVAAGLGARHLVRLLLRTPGLGVQLVAVTVAVWNPFVVERLWMGHWTVLLGYGALPWIVATGLALRPRGPAPVDRSENPAGVDRPHHRARWAWLTLAMLLGSLSHSAGLLSGVALLVAALVLRRGAAARRHNLRVLALVVAVNAPWVAAGWVHRADALSAPGSEVFAAAGSGSLPAPLAWLGLGGIWNTEVVPGSLLGFSAWLGVGVVVALAAIGARAWWAGTERSVALRLLCLWMLGYGVALLTWAFPDLTATLGEVPGGGLVRDGSRMLAWCLPLLVVLIAHGCQVLLARVLDPLMRMSAVALLVLAPVAVLPDVAWGGGTLRAVTFPEALQQVRAVVDPTRGDAVVLPFTSYRAPEWNGYRPVLDPLGRMLEPVTLTSDVLVVNGRSIPGGDPRVAGVALALGESDPGARNEALRDLGVAWVVIDATTGEKAMESVPPIAGRVAFEGDGLQVLDLGEPVAEPADRSTGEHAVLVAGWALWSGAWLVVLIGAARVVLRSRKLH